MRDGYAWLMYTTFAGGKPLKWVLLAVEIFAYVLAVKVVADPRGREAARRG